MSASSIQRQIDNAHKKVGKKLGYNYGLYRPLDSNVDVISDRNLIKYMKATVTLNDNYTMQVANTRWDAPMWVLYSETEDLQMGDYLYSEEAGRTFFVLNKQPHLPVLAIEANTRINIQRVGYGDSGDGFAPAQTTYIAKNLPCFMQYATGSVKVDLPGGGFGVVPFRTMTVYTALPSETMLLGSIVDDGNGFIGDITTYDYSSVGIGVKISVHERGYPSES